MDRASQEWVHDFAQLKQTVVVLSDLIAFFDQVVAHSLYTKLYQLFEVPDLLQSLLVVHFALFDVFHDRILREGIFLLTQKVELFLLPPLVGVIRHVDHSCVHQAVAQSWRLVRILTIVRM